MESQIQVLQSLMKLDRDYFQYKSRIEEIPPELKAIEQYESALRQALLGEEAQLSERQRERRQIEIQIQDQITIKKKYENQIYEIKENRELQSLQREIDFLKRGLTELEEKVLTNLEEEEELQKRLGILREETTRKLEELAFKQKRLAEKSIELAASMEDMEEGRKMLIDLLKPPTRSKYRRIVNAKGHEAIVSVNDGSCGGCFYKLPPQKLAEVKIGQQMALCEGCGRILVWENNH
ncbi:MAG: hypothetical protein KJ970_20990 [Candidatus Eisenbacteria bacterium]|uniref:C4-type zinc ribbon domain-containing protein n=1 Tax=Eiseniibacteriota bacterium TaxID=2212470 RepID=A0A948S1V9_UNCEI|nr:hypothetical protein [Candidatus Eisenbacteria bacterium]MBU1947410.1 hypothetical protein [Candidatus Eisenbacteria bacterium]MBU2693402.1 hypothetical protein [Candidatus Eisenbacteria bacterium]